MPTAPLQGHAVNGALRFLKRQVSDFVVLLLWTMATRGEDNQILQITARVLMAV